MKNQPTYIQYLLEVALILVIGYGASLYFPWWIVAVVAAVVVFILNAKTLSFITGFLAIALLWGRIAYTLSAGNEHILATKMALLFNSSGHLGIVGLALLTAFVGGLVGGLGALTGKLGRQMLK